MKSFLVKLKRILTPLAITNLCAGVLAIIGYLIFGQTKTKGETVLFLLILYFAFVILGAMIAYLIVDRYKIGWFIERASDPTYSLLTGIDQPVLVCSGSGRILWINRAFYELEGGKDPIGQNTSKFFALQPSILCNSDHPNDGISVTLGDKVFAVRGYKMKMNEKEVCVTIWDDMTELAEIRRRYDDERTVFCYVVIDNLDEILRVSEGNFRTVASKIDEIMESWASENGGVLREYDRDKYMILFKASALEGIISGQFEILERIKNAWKGEMKQPVTVSIGIGNVQGSLEERSAASSAALEIALQRGGDQAVVRSETGTVVFGGMTKGLQITTKVRARVKAAGLVELIRSSENVLIMGHRFADFDAFGSCIGIAHFCVMYGKPFNIVCNQRDPNLKKCLLKAENIPYITKDSFIDSTDAQDRVGTKTLLVICDVNNPKEFESPELAANVPTIACIDHHRKTGEFVETPKLVFIEPSASSACELVADMLEQTISAENPGDDKSELHLTQDEAELMLAGIVLDTKNFVINTGQKTFGAARYLRASGAEPVEVRQLFITGFDDYRREAGFERTVMVYKDKYAVAINENSDDDPSNRIAAAKAADKLLAVEGVEASFALCKIGEMVRVSGRSNGRINVQLILESMGGGGRFDAAAAEIKDPVLMHAYALLVQAIDKYENGTLAKEKAERARKAEQEKAEAEKQAQSEKAEKPDKPDKPEKPEKAE